MAAPAVKTAVTAETTEQEAVVPVRVEIHRRRGVVDLHVAGGLAFASRNAVDAGLLNPGGIGRAQTLPPSAGNGGYR